MIKSWKPRFSLRMLAILVTLTCAYLGAWTSTKRWGVPAVVESAEDEARRAGPWALIITEAKSPFPFVVAIAQDRDRWEIGPFDHDAPPLDSYRRHFIWCFGLMHDVPFAQWELSRDSVAPPITRSSSTTPD
jgi:hypothetical protein